MRNLKRNNAVIWLLGGVGLLIGLTRVMPKQLSTCDSLNLTLPDNSMFTTEIADTSSKRTIGLSHRPSLAANHGMLFLFDQPDIYTFWMKDTLIPLDIIWLDDHKIVEMTTLEPQLAENVPRYTPTHSADAVIEMNKNEAAKHMLTIGSQINWPSCHKP